MPILSDYHCFEGRHWETGPVANALAYQGVRAPHTDKPISEALMLGVSGGVAVGYFLFQYQGYEPHLAFMTRNTFDPLDTLYERLALPRELIRTDKPEKAEANLIDLLEQGYATLALLDFYMMPYRNIQAGDESWAQGEILIFGYEDGIAQVADRSSQPLQVSADVLAAARGRIRQGRHRLTTLGSPDFRRLPEAVTQGIWQCISLYSEAPPKGTRNNWGLQGLQHWAAMLRNTRNPQGWTRFFPRGAGLYSALAGRVWQPGLYQWIRSWAVGGGAGRGLYASFLHEASDILSKPGLIEAAEAFDRSASLWDALADASLPENVPLLKESRELLLERHNLFIAQGQAALARIQAIDARLAAIHAEVSADFPMSEAEASALFDELAGRLLAIHDVEHDAVRLMRAAMS